MKARQTGPMITIAAGEALTARRFVDFSGKHTVDKPAIGVTIFDVDSGDQAQLQSTGIAVVESGGAITAGDLVKSDADGKAVSAGTTWDVKVCGVAIDAATDAGEFIQVKLLY